MGHVTSIHSSHPSLVDVETKNHQERDARMKNSISSFNSSSSSSNGSSQQCVISINSQFLNEMEHVQLTKYIMNLEFENPKLWKQYVVQYYLTTRFQFPKKDLTMKKHSSTWSNNEKEQSSTLKNEHNLHPVKYRHGAVLSESDVNLSNLSNLIFENDPPSTVDHSHSFSKLFKKSPPNQSSQTKSEPTLIGTASVSSAPPCSSFLSDISKTDMNSNQNQLPYSKDIETERMNTTLETSIISKSHSSIPSCPNHDSQSETNSSLNVPPNRLTVPIQHDNLFDSTRPRSCRSLPPKPLIRISQYEVEYSSVEQEFRREFLNYQLREYKFPQKSSIQKTSRCEHDVALPDQFLWDLKHSKRK